jgi:UDP-glucose 4-epimerase
MDTFDLVTGGAGFIGSHLVDELVRRGRHVRVLDNFSIGRRANLKQHENSPAVEIVQGDIRDETLVDRVAAGADRIFHLAALADIVPSIEAPDAYFKTNVDGTFALCQAALKHKVRRFVYTASSSCYGIPDKYPTPENTPADPRYPYALTKYLGEQIVMHWQQVYDLPALSLRLFNVYGPRARTSGTYGAVFGVFLAQYLANKPLTIVGDGTQTRDFTYVSDVVAAFLTAAESNLTGRIFNVGTGNGVSVNRIVEIIAPKATTHIPKRPGEPDETRADVTAIQRELGWSAQISIENGIASLMKNLDYWKDAPVWDAASIESATKNWFKYLK